MARSSALSSFNPIWRLGSSGGQLEWGRRQRGSEPRLSPGTGACGRALAHSWRIVVGRLLFSLSKSAHPLIPAASPTCCRAARPPARPDKFNLTEQLSPGRLSGRPHSARLARRAATAQARSIQMSGRLAQEAHFPISRQLERRAGPRLTSRRWGQFEELREFRAKLFGFLKVARNLRFVLAAATATATATE